MDASARRRETKKDRLQWNRCLDNIRKLPADRINSLDVAPENLDEFRQMIGEEQDDYFYQQAA